MERLEPTQLGIMLLSLALLIGVARILGELARHFHQPAILGELIAGLLLGPTLLGTIAPEFHAFLFPVDGPNAIVLDSIGSLAIVLFLLVAGMEVDLSIVWKQGYSALKIGTLGTIIPLGIGFFAALLMPQTLGRQTDADPTNFALFFATAIAISSLPIIAKTLLDMNLYRTDLGMVIVSAAILNDIIGWTIFAVLLGLMGSHGSSMSIQVILSLTLLFAVLTLTLGRWLMHRAIPFLQAYAHYPGGLMGFAITIGLLGAALTEFIGIHAIFGAFLVGIALGDSSHLSERTRVMLDDFISFVFAPVFFASIGLKVNFFTHFDLKLTVLVLLLTVCSKLTGTVLGARWSGFTSREQWAIGFGMGATGAMGIILGTLALDAGIIRQRMFVTIVTTAILTSAMSGPFIRRALGKQSSKSVLSFLSAKLFIRRLSAETRRAALREMSELAAEHTGVAVEKIENQAWNREQIIATGIGNGVAIPHSRLAEIIEPVVVVGISEVGLPFDAPDGQLAHVLFLLVTPQSDPGVQLNLSADIAQIFRSPHCLERVQRAASFTEFIAALNRASEK